MQTHHITFTEQLIQFHFLYSFRQLSLYFRSIRTHLHPESRSNACSCFSCISQPYNADFLSIQFRQFGIPIAEIGIVRPTSLPIGMGIMSHTLSNVKKMCKHHLCHRSSTVGRDIRHNNTAFLGSRYIHYIISGSQDTDIFQCRQCRHILRSNHRLIGYKYFRSGRAFHQLIRSCTVINRQLTQCFQPIP